MKFFCIVLLLALCFTAQADIKRFYRVNQGIYQGTQPKKEDFPKLAQMGIRTVLDLRGGRIHKPRERRRVEVAGMRYISIRVSGIFPPKNWQIAQVLAVLEDPANAPIFLHCWRGDDRVGLVIACYRIDHDYWTNSHVFEEARHEGLNPFKCCCGDTCETLTQARNGNNAKELNTISELATSVNHRKTTCEQSGPARGSPPRVQSH